MAVRLSVSGRIVRIDILVDVANTVELHALVGNIRNRHCCILPERLLQIEVPVKDVWRCDSAVHSHDRTWVVVGASDKTGTQVAKYRPSALPADGQVLVDVGGVVRVEGVSGRDNAAAPRCNALRSRGNYAQPICGGSILSYVH